MPVNKDREYRNMTMRAMDYDPDEARKVVEGYASTFDEAYTLFDGDGWRYDEIVDRGAFDATDMSDVIMQYDHQGRVFARNKNNTLEVIPDEKGLFIRADLGGTELGRELYDEIRGGYTDKMSFGFTVDADERLITEEGGITTVLRTITRIGKLYDVSAVSLPANNATEISARSYCDGVIAELTEERRKAEERERQKQKIKIMLNL